MGSGNQELARAGSCASSDTDDADDRSSGDWRELVQEKDHQITELNKKITRLERKLGESRNDAEQGRKAARDDALRLANKPVTFDVAMFNMVREYAKRDVFRNHKFFTREEDVANYAIDGSAGDMVMKKFGVSEERKGQWWNRYKMAVEEGVNYSRHSTQTLLGKQIKSKYRGGSSLYMRNGLV